MKIKLKLLKEPKAPKTGSVETYKKYLEKHHAIEKENERRVREHTTILEKLERIKKGKNHGKKAKKKPVYKKKRK
jgi:hypothetical protein